jgi:hypothetical protein
MDDIRSKAAEALEKAADVFESGKLQWIQGSLGWAQYGTACARGALFHALSGDQAAKFSDFRSTATVAERAMGFQDGIVAVASLPGWNDRPGRTVDEVIDRMKEGAKRLRNGEPI